MRPQTVRKAPAGLELRSVLLEEPFLYEHLQHPREKPRVPCLHAKLFAKRGGRKTSGTAKTARPRRINDAVAK